MKGINKHALFFLTMILFLSFELNPLKANAQYDDANVTYNDFYQDLAPYGQWIEDPQYGYVFTPTVDDGFRPYYTSGHWVMTSYGNTWVSDYPWGWACFHYGRWIYDSYYGWIWIPGTDWGPAWVCWRFGEGNYGWAPLGPGYDLGSSVPYSCPNDWWVFIPPQYIYSGNYYHYWAGPHGNSQIIHNTEIVNNSYAANGVTFVPGPHSKDIENITHKPVDMYQLTNGKSLTTNVHNNVVKMFRPAMVRPAPSVNGKRVPPPNVVAAPKPIKSAQPVNSAQTSTPPFREDIPQSGHDAVGTHISETATPQAPPKKNNSQPYEWDVNRPVPQPPKPEPQPAPQPQPHPQPNNPQPKPQPHPQPQPKPAPAPERGGDRK